MDSFNEKGAFKEQLGDHSTHDIPDFLSWEQMGPDILAGVEKRKRRRRLLWWWWGGGIALIGLVLLYSISFFQKSASINAFPIDLETTANVSSVNSAASTNEKNRLAVNEDKDEAASANATTPSALLKKMDGLTDTQTTLPETISESSQAERQKTVGHTRVKRAKEIVVEDRLPSSINSPNYQEPQSTNAFKSEDEIVSKKPFISLAKIRSVQPIPNLAASLLPIVTRTDSIQFAHLTPNKRPSTERHWQLELAGGINGWKEQLPSFPASNVALQTPLAGWQINARISRKVAKHWSIKSGVQLQTIRFRSNYQATKEVFVYQPNTPDTIFTSTLTGQQTFIYTDSVPALQTQNFQHFNRHTTLQIPLLIGFELGKKRLKWLIRTGVGFQFFRNSRGRMATAEDEILDIGQNNWNAQLSHLLEAQVTYRLTERIGLFGRWQREQHWNEWRLTNDFAFDIFQQPTIMSGTMGLRWSF
ncbi:MAG: hypothetical protein AAF960_02855 [Bacteroidota bacterium]